MRLGLLLALLVLASPTAAVGEVRVGAVEDPAGDVTYYAPDPQDLLGVDVVFDTRGGLLVAARFAEPLPPSSGENVLAVTLSAEARVATDGRTPWCFYDASRPATEVRLVPETAPSEPDTVRIAGAQPAAAAARRISPDGRTLTVALRDPRLAATDLRCASALMTGAIVPVSCGTRRCSPAYPRVDDTRDFRLKAALSRFEAREATRDALRRRFGKLDRRSLSCTTRSAFEVRCRFSVRRARKRGRVRGSVVISRRADAVETRFDDVRRSRRRP